MDVCECCQCDPCDCHGVNDEEYELWRVGQDPSDPGREDHVMDGSGSGCQSVPSDQVEKWNHSQDRILSEGLCDTVQGSEETPVGSHPSWCFLYWNS